MKSTERHDLRRNELFELLSDPRELLRRYGLTILIIIVAVALAVWLIVRASTAEDRKWQRAWYPLQGAAATHDEEQLRSIADNTKAEALVRAWAHIKHAEVLYHKSRQEQYLTNRAARDELLTQALESYRRALQIGEKWREVLGQASLGMGLCYENLEQFDSAQQQYDFIIAQPEERFVGTVWLAQAQWRKKFLQDFQDKPVVFGR